MEEQDDCPVAVDEKNEESTWRESLPVQQWQNVWEIARNNQLGIDLLLKVGPNEKVIMCHKAVLMVHSPVFEAMMMRRWNKVESFESQDNDVREVLLNDDDPETFEILLQILYSASEKYFKKRSSQLTAMVLMKIIAMSRKYLMPYPLQVARKHLVSGRKLAATGSAIELYQMAKLLQEGDLELYFEEEITSRAYAIFRSDTIEQFSKEDLEYFVGKKDLNSNENGVFRGCLRWARSQCEKQNLSSTGENLCSVLGNIAKLIRFPLMGEEQLLLCVKTSGILLDNELLEIMAHKRRRFATGKMEYEYDQTEYKLPYSTERRERQLSLERCVREIEEKFTLDFETETSIMLDVNRAVKVTGFGFFGGEEDCCLDVEVKIRLNKTGVKLLASKQEKVKYLTKEFENTINVFPIYLEKPLYLKVNTRYCISFSIKGSKTFYSRTPIFKKEAKTHHGKVTFNFHNVKTNKSVRHCGQMPIVYYRFPLDEKEDKSLDQEQERM